MQVASRYYKILSLYRNSPPAFGDKAYIRSVNSINNFFCINKKNRSKQEIIHIAIRRFGLFVGKIHGFRKPSKLNQPLFRKF